MREVTLVDAVTVTFTRAVDKLMEVEVDKVNARDMRQLGTKGTEGPADVPRKRITNGTGLTVTTLPNICGGTSCKNIGHYQMILNTNATGEKELIFQ